MTKKEILRYLEYYYQVAPKKANEWLKKGWLIFGKDYYELEIGKLEKKELAFNQGGTACFYQNVIVEVSNER